MKSIFNSLGSNYSLGFVLSSLSGILFSKKSALTELELKLLSTYKGKELLLLYKGRDAIEACCSVLLPAGSAVITQAFSCYAVEEGIARAGMKPIYADIGKSGSNMTLETIKSAYKAHPESKAVLIQHSLGVPAESVEIRNWCTKHGLVLIEDVAQGIGGVDSLGDAVGTNADAVIFSFGKDKIIDAVSGGAVLFRTLTTQQRERLTELKNRIAILPFSIVLQDMLYPLVTSLIRNTHQFGVGKIVFVLAKKSGLLASPIVSKTSKMCWMHPTYAELALRQLRSLSAQLKHRKTIVKKYMDFFADFPIQLLASREVVHNASNLRLSILCDNTKQVEQIIGALKKKHMYISDRWYKQAVDCGSFACKTAYIPSSCPNAELLASRIVNLPTHRNIGTDEVNRICAAIRESI